MGSDPILGEVFNRLQGEMRMHGFDTILASATGLPSSAEMQRVAELGQAEASVALEQSHVDLTAHVWFVDREVAQARILSISLPSSEDTPALLALRTVELLRSTLRERIAAARTPEQKVPVRPRAVPPGPSRVEAPRPTRRRSGSLRIEFGLAWPTLSMPPVPSVGVSPGIAIQPFWELALRVSLPLSASRLTSGIASAEYRVYGFAFESRWTLGIYKQLRLEPLMDLGVARCTAIGLAAEPYVPLETARWTTLVAVGMGLWLPISTHWSLGGTGRVGFFGPKPIVRVDSHERLLGRPWLDLWIGPSFAF